MAERKTNKEKLSCIEIKVDLLIKHFENHLHKHYQILMLCIGTALTTGIAVVGWIIKSVLR